MCLSSCTTGSTSSSVINKEVIATIANQSHKLKYLGVQASQLKRAGTYFPRAPTPILYEPCCIRSAVAFLFSSCGLIGAILTPSFRFLQIDWSDAYAESRAEYYGMWRAAAAAVHTAAAAVHAAVHSAFGRTNACAAASSTSS